MREIKNVILRGGMERIYLFIKPNRDSALSIYPLTITREGIIRYSFEAYATPSLADTWYIKWYSDNKGIIKIETIKFLESKQA